MIKISQNKIIAILSVLLVVGLVFLVILYTQERGDNPSLNKNGTSKNRPVSENTEIISSSSGIDTAPTVSTSRECNGGNNDDYLHPERFINPDGTLKCADGVVIFDHQIAPKFRRTIIPYIEDETGTTIDLQDVDFYITLLETGETVVFEDIFYWYEDGQRTIFNTNKLLWEKWRDYIEGNNTYTFGVAMIHRPTNTDISIIFKDHTTMTLLFSGLE